MIDQGAGAAGGAERPATPALCTWLVPALNGSLPPVELVAPAGRITAIVGANGSGKSALGYWLSRNAADAPVRRVIAHRRLWFEYAGPDITSAQREQLETNIASWGAQVDSRWRDHAQTQRTGLVLFELLAKINDDNGQVVDLVKQGKDIAEVRDAVDGSLLDRINAILTDAHLPITLTMTDRASFEAMAAPADAPYPISEMSDGEKSALLLAAEVMTVPQGTIVIIDEPERHLHRMISAALIESIVADRPDCHFVVLTHDLDLASSLPRNATTLAVTLGTAWDESRVPVGWDLRVLDATDDIPESVRVGILGGRHRLLFLEGERHSLDLRLYLALFPNWTLVPVGGCDQVIRAVGGLRSSRSHHWVHGCGVVDGDGRNATERETLATKGILSLPVDEVESLYYSDVVRRALAERQAETLGRSPAEVSSNATAMALEAIAAGDTGRRLAASVAEKVVARTICDRSPSRQEIASGVDPITVSTASPFPALLATLEKYLAESDLEGIIREYPIRDSSLPTAVASASGFKTVADYEASALAIIRRDAEIRDSLLELVGRLPDNANNPGHS